MKKTTLINKFEGKLDLAVAALYEARDLIDDLGEIDTYELNEKIEDIEETVAEISDSTRDAIENLID